MPCILFEAWKDIQSSKIAIMTLLRDKFSVSVVPPRSFDLTPLYFLLWCCLNEKEYVDMK